MAPDTGQCPVECTPPHRSRGHRAESGTLCASRPVAMCGVRPAGSQCATFAPLNYPVSANSPPPVAPTPPAACRSGIGVLKVDDNACVQIFPLHAHGRMAAGLARIGDTEQRFEEFAEIARTGMAVRGEVHAGFPFRRRPELLASLPVRAEAVVGGTLLGILEYLVGFLNFLETLFGLRFGADVRMELARQAPVGPLDFLRRGIAFDVQRAVVVPELRVGLLDTLPVQSMRSASVNLK